MKNNKFAQQRSCANNKNETGQIAITSNSTYKNRQSWTACGYCFCLVV